MENALNKERYEATLRDPVAFHKDGDVSRKFHFSIIGRFELSALN